MKIFFTGVPVKKIMIKRENNEKNKINKNNKINIYLKYEQRI